MKITWFVQPGVTIWWWMLVVLLLLCTLLETAQGLRKTEYSVDTQGDFVNDDNDDDVNDRYHPQQACQAWTTPGYTSATRALEGAPAKKLEDLLKTIEQEGSPETRVTCGWEPNLQPMTVHFAGGYNETFYAYKPPDVATFYNRTAGSMKAAELQYQGMFAKFVNMSPDPVQVYWHSGKRGDKPVYIADIEPFGSASTATYPKHTIRVTTKGDPNDVLTEWNMDSSNSLYYYDPFEFDISKTTKAGWNDMQIHMYHIQLVNRAFAYQYKQFTGGTDWLALYKHKNPPRYHMWRADAMGQTFQVDTKEIHFVERPPLDELERGTSVYGPRPDQLERMRPYKDTYPTLNLTLKVLSCSPRVFEIKNFMSDFEVDHILGIAKKQELHRSGTSGSDSSISNTDSPTRTSSNSWIARNTDVITDAIHRRAADVLHINEALLRWRRESEVPEFSESMISIAERLQLIHYAEGQQYAPHHDFAMPGMVKDQPSRFATMLFYLNDDMEGGETVFPRWLNAESGLSLKVKPERGKAVLFYNMLPDGNYDERSIHASMKVTNGEKYLINLWIWDPVLDHTKTEHI